MPRMHDVVFSGLHLPRPLDPAAVTTFLSRVAADRAAPRLVLETRADGAGTRHLLGCRRSDVHTMRRLLADFLPGSVLTSSDGGVAGTRRDVDTALRLRLRPRTLPLRTDTAEASTRALLSTLTALQAGEIAVLQVVLGPRHAPRLVADHVPAPDATVLDALTIGVRPATREVRNRLQERLGHGRISATIRLGAASPDPDRRRRFLLGMLSALSIAQAAGVHLDLVRQQRAAINQARLPWYWPLRLTASELVGLLGWPLGEEELPGLPPLHPKAIRAASVVHTGPRVVARSAAPGDDRLLGIAPADQLLHAVSYGPSGSGKTTVALHLICADIAAGRAVAVLDPKKQLIDDILGLIPQERIKDVVILDASQTHPVGFNPLDVTGRDPDVVVDGILAVFESVFHDGWGPRSADIFSAALRTLARASTSERPATLL
ncbi:MAG: type IV secretory system conjugative DNA transfer family protein, partial [Sciscionella sp.]